MIVYVNMIIEVEETHMLAASFDRDKAKERLESGNVIWRQKRKSDSFSPGIREGWTVRYPPSGQQKGKREPRRYLKTGECAWSTGPGTLGYMMALLPLVP